MGGQTTQTHVRTDGPLLTQSHRSKWSWAIETCCKIWLKVRVGIINMSRHAGEVTIIFPEWSKSYQNPRLKYRNIFMFNEFHILLLMIFPVGAKPNVSKTSKALRCLRAQFPEERLEQQFRGHVSIEAQPGAKAEAVGRGFCVTYVSLKIRELPSHTWINHATSYHNYILYKWCIMNKW